MATDTTLAPVFDTDRTYGPGNLKLSTLASNAKAIKRFLRRETDAPMPFTWCDGSRNALTDPTLLCGDGERWFITSTDRTRLSYTGETTDNSVLADNEVAHVTPVSPDEVRVTFPERDTMNDDGEHDVYSYVTDADSLLARMEADGGWTEIRPFMKLKTGLNCPECGSFMSIRDGGYELPEADCTALGCHGWMDDYELMERDYMENVF